MKYLYYFILISSIFFISTSAKAQKGCITCALSKILKDDWKNPSAGGNGAIYSTYGWKFNLRNRYGQRIKDKKLVELEKKLNSSNVQRIQRQVTQFVSNGWLKIMIVPHIITLKSGEPYYVYQEYITGFSH